MEMREITGQYSQVKDIRQITRRYSHVSTLGFLQVQCGHVKQCHIFSPYVLRTKHWEVGLDSNEISAFIEVVVFFAMAQRFFLVSGWCSNELTHS